MKTTTGIICFLTILSCGFSFRPPPIHHNRYVLSKEDLMYQLYGEWMVWHSTTSSSFYDPNTIMVRLYPSFCIDICIKHNIGPFIIEEIRTGRIRVRDMNCRVLMNKDLSEFQPVCTERVYIGFLEKRTKMISAFGIGMSCFEVCKPHHQLLSMDLHVVGRDDLYMTKKRRNDKQNISYHLVRSVRSNQPSIDVPFLTLVSTQLVGMFVCKILKILMDFYHIHV